MLSVHKIVGGPSAASYYLDQIARGRDDYYAGHGEEAGQWVGAGAPLLEWSGEVDGDDFVSVLGGAGVRKPRPNGVAGFDLTFRAPKSVSLLWAIGSPDVARELRAGHDAAVAEALGYLEREACRGRRGTDGVIQVRGAGFVGAAFVHRSSRAGDPLLHTHVVVGNLTRGPDGRWTALDGRHLYRQQKAAGFLYQAVLRRELTERLGLQWGPVHEGMADVRGVARSVIEHFSRRRSEILEHMAARGGRSAASAEIAALETRRAKQDVPFDRLRLDWTARAAEHGLTREIVDELLGGAEVRSPRIPEGITSEVTEQASTFGRAELLQALAAAQPAGARVAELQALADRVLADEEVVALPQAAAKAGVVEARYSTRELLAIEARLLDSARARRHSHAARVDAWTLRRVLENHPTLTAEQADVVRALCGGGDGVSIVRAPAGTGKTFMLDAAREVWGRDDVAVRGCALSARAALELEDQASIPSVTVAAVKRHLEQGRGLPLGSVLVVDEAGMVGTRDIALLAQAAAEADAKVVLVGDDRQLPEIDAGGAFHALAEQLGALELTEVRRQSEPWDRDALAALRAGDVERWARAYRAHGRITVAETARDARAALVNDWSRAEGEAVMIASRRADVRDLNERARQVLQDKGKLGKPEVEVAGRRFAEGDRVVGTRNDRGRGILNGQRGTVIQIDPQRRSVMVRLDGGHEVTLDSGYTAENLDHAYALTAHKAQGATVDRAFVLGSQDLYRELGYTALSRHRQEARFYVARGDIEAKVERDIPNYDPVVHGIEQLLKRSGAKRLAHDSLADRAASRPRKAAQPPTRDTDEARREREQAKQARRDPTIVDKADGTEEAQRAEQARLRESSHADRLDHGSPSERDTSELVAERDELRKVFVDNERPRVEHLTEAEREHDTTKEMLAATEKRLGYLQDLRDDTGLFEFGKRRHLKERIEAERKLREAQRERHERARDAYGRTTTRIEKWLGIHGDQAERLVAIHRELTKREQLEKVAVARQQAVERTPNWPERELPQPKIELDRDLDFGLDLD